MKENLNRIWESLKEQQAEEQKAVKKVKLIHRELSKIRVSSQIKAKVEKLLRQVGVEVDTAEAVTARAKVTVRKAQEELRKEIAETGAARQMAKAEDKIVQLDIKIRECTIAFENGDYLLVKSLYDQIREAYAGMDPQTRSVAYGIIMELRQKISTR